MMNVLMRVKHWGSERIMKMFSNNWIIKTKCSNSINIWCFLQLIWHYIDVVERGVTFFWPTRCCVSIGGDVVTNILHYWAHSWIYQIKMCSVNCHIDLCFLFQMPYCRFTLFVAIMNFYHIAASGVFQWRLLVILLLDKWQLQQEIKHFRISINIINITEVITYACLWHGKWVMQSILF